tara:strand:+ start:455 stop:682 length:228 start_codon:yes stop_codon:yes gene_type:complete
MNENEVQKLTEIILREAVRKEDAGSYSEANKLRSQVEFFMYGFNASIPPEWKKFQVQLDPEYPKYLELKKKFEKE